MSNNYSQSPELPIVHIIDDDDAVLDSLSLLFDSVEINAIGYHSGAAFLEAYQTPDFNLHTGCIVLDIRMPIMSGMDCQKKLNELGCPLPIIFITGHGDVSLAVEAMKNGAFDFIEKPLREQTLITAVQAAITRSIRDDERHQRVKDTTNKMNSLTEREKQILNRVIDGKANKTIASELHLSERTIEIHRAHVMEKMQAGSLAQLVRMVLDAANT
ncbi:response regulator transcription factor [Ningiella sp. W23]|uniref:response regulator transcription factor n=1 Tax=Ningiella sp. W23 TaxID=3023715 RepID=UPI003756391F